jgi:cytochrome c oxidase assembly factor CtaG
MAEAILTSWRFDPVLIILLAAVTTLYIRGWLRLHWQAPHRYTTERLLAWLAGVAVIFVALASPLDAFGNLLLSAHMVQHLLLIVVAPPLILLGQPSLPILRGLPSKVFRDGLGPFLSWHWLQRLWRRITNPLVCWLAMAGTIVFWHSPRWYELALNSPGWHEAEHACFFYAALLFWSPVTGIWPSHPQWPRWMMIPYLVLADIVNTGLSAWLVFSTHVVYRTYEAAPRLSGMSALDDQSTAGAIMWVPGSIAYLIPAFVLTMQIVNGSSARPRSANPTLVHREAAKRPLDLFRLPVLGPILRYRHFRRILQTVLFLLAVAVIIDGFAGPQMAALNLAGLLPWTYWRGFAVIGLIVAGNFFCMACPFTFLRELGRGFLPGRFHWPKALRSKWLAVGLFLLYLWANEVFGLWNSPWWTAWIVAGYFIAALLINGLFQGASFCKYVCPIGQFHFVNTLVSPFEVKVRSAPVCAACKTEDCIKGNNAGSQNLRGCELYLFQPMKTGNFDCTFCLDCVKACPQDNVGLLAVAPGSSLLHDRRGSGIGRLSQRSDAAALVWVMVFGAMVSAAAMVDPVMRWMHFIHARLRLSSMMPVTTGFFLGGIVAVPLLLAWICGSASALIGKTRSGLKIHWKTQAKNFAFTLIPLGAGMWTAHFSFHLLTAWRSILPVAARIAGLPSPAMDLVPSAPEWLPALQLLLLDGGLVLSVYLAWNTARSQLNISGQAFRLLIPWALLAMGIYAVSVWILLQPMQMRGMVM